MTAATETPATSAPPTRRLHALWAALIGVASAAVGLVPWFLTGGDLAPQAVWETNDPPTALPFALVPLGAYAFAGGCAMLGFGAALAGAAVALARRWGRLAPVRATVLGLVATQVIALVQSAMVLGGGVGDGSDAMLYALVFIAIPASTIALGAVVAVAIARGNPAPATMAISLGGIAAGMWLISLVFEVATTPGMLPVVVLRTMDWLPALIAGAAIGWCGVATARRGAASLASLAIVWIVPALATAAQYALGTRIYLQYPAELIPAGSHVFRQALGPDGGAPMRVGITVVAAVVVWIALRWRASQRTAAPPLP